MEKLKYPKQSKSILIGITEDRELVFINIEIGSCDNNHFTITHKNYDRLIKETDGGDLARDYLQEGELWKMAVQEGHTTLGLNEWVDLVINTDGWESVVGDLSFIGEYEEEGYYIQLSSIGASIEDLNKKYKKLFITEEERQILIESDKLHLKDFNKYTKKEKKLFEKVYKLFQKDNINIFNMNNQDILPLLIEE